MRRFGLLVALMLSAGVLFGCGKAGIIAEGGDFVLTVEDLRREISNLGPGASYDDTYEGRKALVERLATRHFLSEEAMDRGYGGKQLEGVLRDAETTSVAEIYRRWKVEKRAVVPRIKAKPWMDKLDRLLHLKEMILKSYPLAEEALNLMRLNQDFEGIVEKVSGRQDIEVRDIGFRKWKGLDPRVAPVVFQLQPGEVSGIVRNSYGYSIYYVVEDQPQGLMIEMLSMRSKKALGILKEQRLLERERDELASAYNVRLHEEGIRAALEAFRISFSGTRPPDSLLAFVVATYRGGELKTADLFTHYYSADEASRPYPGDYHGIRESCLDLMLPKLEALAGYEAGLQRLPEVTWNVKKARQELLIPMMEQAIRSTIEIAEQDIVDYYHERKDDLLTSGSYKARRILIESQREAREALREIRSGKDFAQVAKEKSLDKYSAPKGGELSFVRFGIIEPYDSVVAQLQPGEVSSPFETRDGIEILKLEEVIEPRQLNLDEARPYIREFISNTRANELLRDLVDERKSEVGYAMNEDLLRRVSLPLPEWARHMGEGDNT